MVVHAESGKIWKVVVVAHFKVLSQHLSKGTEEAHKRHQTEEQVSRPKNRTWDLQNSA